jgi:hypothetical protein
VDSVASQPRTVCLQKADVLPGLTGGP